MSDRSDANAIRALEPEVAPIHYGWMARTQADAPLSVAVIGADEADARRRFREEVEAWARLRDQPAPELPEG